MCETCCSPFAEKCKSKGKRAQSKIKDRESLREEAARGLQCETHTRRAVQWWQNMEFCALLHTNRHFVFAVFHLSSFPACLVLSVYASEPGSKWLVLRATTPTADDDQEFFDYTAIVLTHLTSTISVVTIQEPDRETGNFEIFSSIYFNIHFNIHFFKTLEFKMSYSYEFPINFNLAYVNIYKYFIFFIFRWRLSTIGTSFEHKYTTYMGSLDQRSREPN